MRKERKEIERKKGLRAGEELWMKGKRESKGVRKGKEMGKMTLRKGGKRKIFEEGKKRVGEQERITRGMKS